ncbi:MAG: murU [Frankiales bacterium]|nr:murU [Frankiales bacterium]
MAGTLPRTAMVFAAGRGTRMQPITETLPKPLVKVAGKALIDHVLDRLAVEGVETAVVNVHYLADQIEAHLKDRTTPRIVISDERSLLLDQGGGIKKALPHLGKDPFLVVNTDAFWIEGPTSNLTRLAQAWNPEAMDTILLLASTTASVGVDWPGDFQMDSQGVLTKRPETEVAPFVYSGIGILKPEPFARDAREVFGLAPFLFDSAKRRRLFGVRLEGLWLHVGTPRAIVEAEEAIERSLL